MTERDRREEARRGEDVHREERGADAPREESAPRRAGEVRREHETEREAERARRERELGTSWPSIVLGWLTALGAGLILSGIIGGTRCPTSRETPRRTWAPSSRSLASSPCSSCS